MARRTIRSKVKPKPIEKPKKRTSMYNDDNIPNRLLNGFPRPTPNLLNIPHFG